MDEKIQQILSQGSDGLIVAQGSGTFHDKGIDMDHDISDLLHNKPSCP